MAKTTLLIAFFVLSFGLANVQAGRYECYNFNGTIDKYPITLLIQVRHNDFGSNTKTNIIGVYKYDRYNTPIRLEGELNFDNNKALLYEINNNKRFATFEFEFSKGKCKGVWRNLSNNKTMLLQLNFVSQLIDTLGTDKSARIEILQANSLADFYFVGDYTKDAGDTKAKMDKMKIIKKKDNSVFQVLDFSKIKAETGNVSSIIFDNVEVLNSKTKDLLIWNSIGQMGVYLLINYDAEEKKFKLNPNPLLVDTN